MTDAAVLCLALVTWILGAGSAGAQPRSDPIPAAGRGTTVKAEPGLQTSGWGSGYRGLQCRAVVPTAVEEGKPVPAFIELRKDPLTHDPSVGQINLFMAGRFASLSLTNSRTQRQFRVQPFELGGPMAIDLGKATIPFAGADFPQIQASFPLVKLYKVLEPGSHNCVVTLTFVTNHTAGLWDGTISSGPFTLQVPPEVRRTKTFLVPKRVPLSKEVQVVGEETNAPMVAVPVYRFSPADAQEIRRPVRNGHFIGTRCTDAEGMSITSGPLEPGDPNPLLALYEYKGGGQSTKFTIELFETADPPQHLWSPGPGSGGYRVLWGKTCKLSFSEKEFEKMPPTGLDYSKSRISDIGLAELKQYPLQRLSLGNNQITDDGLLYVGSLKRLQSLHLYGTRITDAGLAHLEHLSNLRELNLAGTSLTDRGLAHLSQLTNLVSLDLARTGISNEGLKQLGRLQNLKELLLFKTRISDDGLRYLRPLTKLELLFLSDTAVTDAGLVHLISLTNLSSLRLDRTKVTPKGAADLQKRLPECSIESDTL